MADLQKDILSLHDPSNIKNAQFANSPYVLKKILSADPIIRRLIDNGEKVIPLIAEEMKGKNELNEITMSAYAFIVSSIKAGETPGIFGPTFIKVIENPGPFYVHFAANALRLAFHLPVKPLEMVYSRAELIETRDMLK